MIKPVSSLIHLLPMINQEGNAQPGEGLTAFQTVTYFFLIPLGLFAVIGGLAWLSSAPKKERKDVINKISDDDDSSFLTMI
jgi:hypothetical protein